MRRPLTIVSGLCLVMGLAQCVPATSTTSSAATPAQRVATSQAANSDGGALLNSFRAQNGLPALRQNAALTRAANAHAMDMGTNSFMSHISSNGDKVRDRVRKQGYAACGIAENVALGQGSSAEVINQWMNSPPHRKNILNRTYQEYGLARGPGNAWVLVFAQPGCG